ncbi:MAG: helix-turn-helix domain-containing protein [Propionibacteriaceae bacterium]|jgi:hypothetical protein|nr:helix-turn-helix domain-containing protein [Propionibacteriaceae bacterium]
MIGECLRDAGQEARLTGPRNATVLQGVRVGSAGVWEPGYLYLCPAGAAPPADPGLACLFVGPPDPAPATGHLVAPADADPLRLLALVGGLFARFADWERELLQAAAEGASIEAMLELGQRLFDNPVYAYDASLRLLGDAVEFDEATRLTVTARGAGEVIDPAEDVFVDVSGRPALQDHFTRLLEDIGLLPQLRQSQSAFRFRGAKTPLIAANLTVQNHQAGFLTVAAVRTPLAAWHTAAADVFAFALSQVVERVLLRAASVLEPISFPMIEMLGTDSEYQLRQLARTGWKRHDRYLVMVVRPVVGSRAVDCYSGLFQRLFPRCQMVTAKTHLIVIIHGQTTRTLTDRLERYRLVFHHNELVCGVSMDFADFMEAREFYSQALAAVERCSPDDAHYPLAFYADHLTEHMTQVFAEFADPRCYALPYVRLLADYDDAHEGHLLDTLYTYLTHDRSHEACTEKLFIHKSTLKYRLSKIRQIVGDDCLAPENRTGVLMSVCLIRLARRSGPELAPLAEAG